MSPKAKLLSLVSLLIFSNLIIESNSLSADNITLIIKPESNNKIKIIGNNGTFEIITDYNDAEKNIFNSQDLDKFTFNNTLIDNNKNSYNIKCRFWKPNNAIIKIFCRPERNLINDTQKYNFSNINISYNNYNINIINMTPLNIKQINDDIPFIYSRIQKINLESGNILSFKFYFDHYSNENLFLYDNKFKYAFFDNCKINGKNTNELICEISSQKLKGILSTSGEKFYLADFNIYKGQYVFESVDDIIIESNIIKKDFPLEIKKLKNNIVDMVSFIYYETNITNIYELTTNIFSISFNGSTITCMFKKYTHTESLFLICHALKSGNTSLGEIKQINLSNINIEYNFIIKEGFNNENISINGVGGAISAVYPEILDFTNKDNLILKIGVLGNLKGIKLNPDSSNDLVCKSSTRYIECIVPKNHFDKKETGYYYIHSTNYLNKSFIRYESPAINIILPKEEDSDNTMTIIIVVVSIVSAIIIVAIVVILIRHFKKGDIAEMDGKDNDNDDAIPLTDKPL